MVDFYCYNDMKGKPDANGQRPNLWRRWYDEQSRRVKAKHDSVLRILTKLTVWGDPYFHGLGGNGLEQIIIKTDVQWRIVGYRSEDLKEFTVVSVCYHKDRQYYPKDAEATAERIMNEIKEGTSERIPCEPPE